MLNFLLAQCLLNNYLFPIIVILNLREINANRQFNSVLKVGSRNWLSKSLVFLDVDESCLVLLLSDWAFTALWA